MNRHGHFLYLPHLKWYVPVLSEVSDVKLLLYGSKAENHELLLVLAKDFKCLFLISNLLPNASSVTG